jgi:hypothetical protein
MVMMHVSVSFVVVVGSFHVVVCSNSGERGARKRRLSVFFSVVRGGAEWRYIETADDPKMIQKIQRSTDEPNKKTFDILPPTVAGPSSVE